LGKRWKLVVGMVLGMHEDIVPVDGRSDGLHGLELGWTKRRIDFEIEEKLITYSY
jgi:hypothetical protein